MHRKNLSTSILLVCSICFLSSSHAQNAPLVQQAEEILKKVTSETTSGVALLVARDGEILVQAAGGMANLAEKTPVTTDTKFRIGSVSKQFTAMGILRLAEQGKLSLQDPLSKYYPDFPNGEATLENLLTHTSGLHSYTEKPEFLLRVSKEAKPASIIKWFQHDSPGFSPGQNFKYCNSGYFLLGEIIATISGKSYADFLNDEFFKPLGMNDTGVYVNSNVPTNMAIGYSLADDKYDLSLDWDMCWAGGAGALYSTVGDLHRWNEALYGGKIINAESLTKATTPVSLPAGVNGMNYGYGLAIAEYRRLPMISHSGGLNGWTSDLAYFPEQKCTVAVLTNAHPAAPELTPQVISRKLIDSVLEKEFKARPQMEVDTSIDPKSYAELVGKYDYQGSVASITVEDEKIYAQLTGQPKLEIFPKAKDQFFWKVVDAEVAFERNEAGEVVGARHTQNGATFSAPRIQGVELSAEALKAFVGRYRYGIALMTTTVEDNQLYAQITGQPKFPIFPINENTFKWRVAEAQVEFVKDENGEVITARHTQNGTTFDAAKIKPSRGIR